MTFFFFIQQLVVILEKKKLHGNIYFYYFKHNFEQLFIFEQNLPFFLNRSDVVYRPTALQRKHNKDVNSGRIRTHVPLRRRNHHLIRHIPDHSVTKSFTTKQSYICLKAFSLLVCDVLRSRMVWDTKGDAISKPTGRHIFSNAQVSRRNRDYLNDRTFDSNTRIH